MNTQKNDELPVEHTHMYRDISHKINYWLSTTSASFLVTFTYLFAYHKTINLIIKLHLTEPRYQFNYDLAMQICEKIIETTNDFTYFIYIACSKHKQQALNSPDLFEAQKQSITNLLSKNSDTIFSYLTIKGETIPYNNDLKLDEKLHLIATCLLLTLSIFTTTKLVYTIQKNKHINYTAPELTAVVISLPTTTNEQSPLKKHT